MPKVLPEYLESRRRQILEAASECFSHEGFHQTSMQDICERAELSPGALYRYFKGKDQIIAAICDEHHQQDLSLIEGIKSRGDTVEVLEELGRAFLGELSEADARLHIDLLAEVPRSPYVRETVGTGSAAIIDSFADFVRRAQERGDVAQDVDAEAVAQFMCALYHGFIVLKQVNPGIDANRYFDAVMAVFRGGLFSHEAAASGRAALSH